MSYIPEFITHILSFIQLVNISVKHVEKKLWKINKTNNSTTDISALLTDETDT